MLWSLSYREDPVHGLIDSSLEMVALLKLADPALKKTAYQCQNKINCLLLDLLA